MSEDGGRARAVRPCPGGPALRLWGSSAARSLASGRELFNDLVMRSITGANYHGAGVLVLLKGNVEVVGGITNDAADLLCVLVLLTANCQDQVSVLNGAWHNPPSIGIVGGEESNLVPSLGNFRIPPVAGREQ